MTIKRTPVKPKLFLFVPCVIVRKTSSHLCGSMRSFILPLICSFSGRWSQVLHVCCKLFDTFISKRKCTSRLSVSECVPVIDSVTTMQYAFTQLYRCLVEILCQGAPEDGSKKGSIVPAWIRISWWDPITKWPILTSANNIERRFNNNIVMWVKSDAISHTIDSVCPLDISPAFAFGSWL